MADIGTTPRGFHPDGRDCWVSTGENYEYTYPFGSSFPSRRAGLLGFYLVSSRWRITKYCRFHPDGRDCWVSTSIRKYEDAGQSFVSIPTGGIVGFLRSRSVAERCRVRRRNRFHPDGRDCWVSTQRRYNVVLFFHHWFPSRRAGLLGFYRWGILPFL
jgi:hypothetical protein